SERLRRGVSSLALGRPWFDGAALSLLRRYFFPLSRTWAAAHLADGRVEAFAPAGPGTRSPRDTAAAAKALIRFERARATAAALDAAWEHVFFGPHDFPQPYRSETEAARLAHRHAFNATRRHFWRLLGPDVPSVRLAVATPDEVDAVHGAALADAQPSFAPPSAWPPIAVSRTIPGRAGTDCWIRFPSPSARLGDMVTARVYAPIGVANPPTVIFGHGVCVEFDHWQGLVDEVDELVRGGVRVIRPEAPWHGRRTPAGYFGGERLISTFPMGLLDAMTGAVREWSVLAHWARTTSSGPLGFGGTSLGALTAQLAADRSHDWPAALRPEALLLITHCGHVGDAVLDGALTQLWGGPEVAAAKGWTEALARPYFTLLDPGRRPVMASRRIVSVLGRRDVVTPFAGGRDLVERWCVPADNTFLLDRGHFSVPMTLLGDAAPVRRFIAVLSGAD
ncbi:MAG: alpha/beta hydrolase family protein, partial [Hyphomicrobium sp.]